MRSRAVGLIIAIATSLSASAIGLAAQPDDGSPKPRSFTCPLGGAKFEQTVEFPHFPLVEFPDASHMGDEFIDAQIPECPGSRLLILPDYSVEPPAGEALVYHSYTAEELQRLPALLTDLEWKALAGATRHQRAYWLATRLGRPANDRIQLLIRAQWATAAHPAQHRQALEQLARDLPGLIDEAKPKPDEAAAIRFLRINALRELGGFDEARAALDEMERGGTKLLGPNDPDAMFNPGDYSVKMRAAIDAGDDDRLAIGLLTDNFAGRVCGGGDFSRYAGKHAASACAARKRRQEEQQAMFDRAHALEADKPALEKRCAALPADNRDDALAYACHNLVHERDWAAGQKLADDEPAKVAAMCETTNEEKRTTVQASACSSYDTYRWSVDTALLTQLDEPSYAAVCDGKMRAAFMFGCDQAYGYRANAAAKELLKDEAALKPKCAEKERKEPYALQMACDALEARDPPYWMSQEPPVVSSDPLARAAMPFAEAALKKAIARAEK